MSRKIASGMSARTQDILRTLVKRYIQDGQPVGSKHLAIDAGISSATIRTLMAELEDQGYIKSPHTSAGRIPTVRGYRLFVDSLLTARPLSMQEVSKLPLQLSPNQTPSQLLESASELLSSITQLAGIVTLPMHNISTLQHIEFLLLGTHQLLVILVFGKNEVQNRIIELTETYSQSQLQQMSNYLNAQVQGKTLTQIREELLEAMRQDRQHLDGMMLAAIQLADQAFDQKKKEDGFFVSGQSKLMELNEMSNVERLRKLFEAFNQKRDILHLLDRCACANGLQVFIGEESGFEILDECSLVTSPYEVDGKVVGALGVIGPTRMAYDQIIPIVDVTAKILGLALNQQK